MAQVKYQSIFYFDIRYYNVGRYWSQSVWAENCTARDQLDVYQPLWKASRQASTQLLFNLTNTHALQLLGALLWRIFVTGCLVSSIDSENVLALYLKMGRKTNTQYRYRVLIVYCSTLPRKVPWYGARQVWHGYNWQHSRIWLAELKPFCLAGILAVSPA